MRCAWALDFAVGFVVSWCIAVVVASMIAAVIRDRDGPPNRDRCDDARLRSAAVGSRSLFHRDAMRTLSCLAARSSFKRSESCGRSLHPVLAAPLTGTQRQIRQRPGSSAAQSIEVNQALAHVQSTRSNGCDEACTGLRVRASVLHAASCMHLRLCAFEWLSSVQLAL